MKKFIWILLPLSLLLFACRTNKGVIKTEVINVPPQPPNPDAGESALNEPIIYRLTLSFYSIGEGIDNDNMDKWVEFLDKHSPAVLYEKVGWGREGEIDYCLMLNELKPKEQEEFVADAKKLLEKCKHVHINEFKPCRHKK